jgi:transposase
MKIISLDVHSEKCQLVACMADGEIFLETIVPTKTEDLKKVIGAIPGPKRVIFEEGPMSGLIHDALHGLVDELVSSDPTKNALIARAEFSNDEVDARQLIVLDRAGSLRAVYVPPEPFRTLRSLLAHDQDLTRMAVATICRLKALRRRLALPSRGAAAFRPEAPEASMTAELRWQFESLRRQLAHLRKESLAARRQIRRLAGRFPVYRQLMTIPGVGPIIASTFMGWVVDPRRFKSLNALSSYAGLGLGQGFTAWRPVGPARASKRGQRALKRVLFLAAKAALKGDHALHRRYDARIAAGWEPRKAMRDLARTILFIAQALWIHEEEYRDDRVNVPATRGHAG